ncbi:phospholipid-binding protein, PBP family [Chitinasiproducens palmae]|uniref:Phospholipid-binding protein, PBP family n=2 Tax=Chitinasiproducens palmae TaxID=1770053 RepID=A0A1H2PNU3_9BURK|nr:phospholipid-binding protein, PBP family [Chitinasiproducens palmae]
MALADGTFTLRSAAFHEGQSVPPAQRFNRDGCTGGNVSPPLSWQHAPPNTASFAIMMHDPDAPGRGWWHWAVANIPATVHSLPANASASGALTRLGALQARNDFSDEGYGGPCPPPGKRHRYVITIYALNAPLTRLVANRPAPFFEHEILGAAIAKASLTLTDQR